MRFHFWLLVSVKQVCSLSNDVFSKSSCFNLKICDFLELKMFTFVSTDIVCVIQYLSLSQSTTVQPLRKRVLWWSTGREGTGITLDFYM